MDQSESIDLEALCLTKLAMLGCTVETCENFYFIYFEGRIKLCGEHLEQITVQMICNLQKGLYR